MGTRVGATNSLKMKAKLKYEKSSKDLETARNELLAAKSAVTDQDPQAVKISKLEKNVSIKETECNLSETQYKLQVQASNSFLESYQLEKWPYVLNEFEQFEITRISFMKANIHNFLGLLKELPSVLESEVAAGLKVSEQIDPDVDLQIFIEANKSPKELLSPFVFEQYQEKVSLKTSNPSVSRPISQIWDNLRLLGSKEEVKAPSAFGVSLTDLMEKQQKEEPSLLVPKVLAILTEGILTQNGLNTEGIFRLAGSSSEVQNVRKQLDKGDYNISSGDVHVLASIIKQFLRELPEAVIPTSFYYLFAARVLLRSPQKEPTALLAGLTNEFSFVEKLILTAPLLDADQFPIFAILHQTSKALPPLPSPPASTVPQLNVTPASPSSHSASSTFTPASPSASSTFTPASPASHSASSTLTLGEAASVAYSTTTDPSYTSFEDMSSNKDDQISDFSETDHFEDEAAGVPVILPRSNSGNSGNSGRELEGHDAKGRLGSSEELPEFVFVPTSPRSES